MIVRGEGWLECGPEVGVLAVLAVCSVALKARMQASLGLTLQRFLVASYAYYVLDKTVMPDEEYDGLARFLLSGWDEFEHQHKRLVTRADLEAGTLFSLNARDYPRIVVGAATRLIYDMGNKT